MYCVAAGDVLDLTFIYTKQYLICELIICDGNLFFKELEFYLLEKTNHYFNLTQKNFHRPECYN